jgi:hypothetical protein
MAEQVHIFGRVTHTNGAGPVENARVQLLHEGHSGEIQKERTNAGGVFAFKVECEESNHVVVCEAFGKRDEKQFFITQGKSNQELQLDLHLGFQLAILNHSGHEERLLPALHAIVGRRMLLRAETAVDPEIGQYRWQEHKDAQITPLGKEAELVFARSGRPRIEAIIIEKEHEHHGSDYEHHGPPAQAKAWVEVPVGEPDVQTIGGHVRVSMERTPSDCTLDQALWVAIRNRTDAISFDRYRNFIARVLNLEEHSDLEREVGVLRQFNKYFRGVGAYNTLKYLTQAFLVLHSGVKIERDHRHYRFDPGEEARRLGDRCHQDIENRLQEYLGEQHLLPYLTRVVDAAFPEFERELRPDHRELYGTDRLVLAARLDQPVLIELIHAYWLEEGMLMQTMNALTERFQNVSRSRNGEPLANVVIDFVRPLNPLLWGHVKDQINQLSVRQRALEYLAEYGLPLLGRATAGIRPADNRSTFLAAFHNLLYQSTVFFKEDFQTTVIADGFPLLNALKEVHIILAQGAGNQFGDLPWTARVETLLMQFILARPEIRDFLQSRPMVPYKEAWMPQVDTMKTLQGWTDVTVTHFRDLAVYGEQLLLSIRYGDWINVNDEDSAKNWARYWRAEIQAYLHAYRGVTGGVDLGSPVTAGTVDATVPAVHLQKRLEAQTARAKTPAMLGYKPSAGQSDLSRIPYSARRSQ